MNKYLQVFVLSAVAVVVLSSFTRNMSFLPTSLKVTVLDDVGNLVEGAEVTLYKTKDDYYKEVNPITETLKTNEKGFVKFKNLLPEQYYVLAEFGKQTNAGAGVLTNTLEEGRTNKVNTIIK